MVSTMGTAPGGSNGYAAGDGAQGARSAQSSGGVFGASRRQRGLPWVAMGVLMMAMSILGFALWSMQQASRSPILVAKNGIDAGAVIQQSDVRLVSVGADEGLAVMGRTRLDVVVGSVARAPIPEGTPFSEALLLTEADQVEAGTAVVGASLEPGEYPTPYIGPGDRVGLISVSSGSGASSDEVVDLGEGVVLGAKALDEFADTRLFVSMVVPAESAASVADAASGRRLRLVILAAQS